MNKNLLNLGNNKSEVVRNNSLEEIRWGGTFIEKKQKMFDWLWLKHLHYLGKIGWLVVIGSLYRWRFLNLEAFTGLDFALFVLAAKVLELSLVSVSFHTSDCHYLLTRGGD